MTYAGPWIQPPSQRTQMEIGGAEYRTPEHVVAGTLQPGLITHGTSAPPFPSMLDKNFISSGVHPSASMFLLLDSMEPSYAWEFRVTLLAADMGGLFADATGRSEYMPPAVVDPSSYPPGAVGYETETDGGIYAGGGFDLNLALTFNGGFWVDDIEGKTPDPAADVFATNAQLRRVPAADYDATFTAGTAGLSPDLTWPDVTGWTVLLEDGATFAPGDITVSSSGGTDNYMSGAPSIHIAPTTLHLADSDLDAGMKLGLLVDLDRMFDGRFWVSLYVDPSDFPPPTYSNGLMAKSSVGELASVNIAWTYTPPRYRFIFDRLPPLRQHPRDDSLGGSPRQGHVNQPKSTQSSARQGWVNAYR